MADCEVEGTIASPLSIPLERTMSPTGERRDEARNIRTRQNPFGPQERQTHISKAKDFKGTTLDCTYGKLVDMRELYRRANWNIAEAWQSQPHHIHQC
ncbi:hypothetical protein TNCV_5138121 [Trichonephila clavipes]|nr:hypothetical protein TNCV_5138121 [Trichonephila clavipes]